MVPIRNLNKKMTGCDGQFVNCIHIVIAQAVRNENDTIYEQAEERRKPVFIPA